jgi:dephospho-CoA kinase
MLAERGALVFSSDEMARQMMQPGHAVFAQIVAKFGDAVQAADGSLDRKKLAALAFDPLRPRVEELNAIVHPAVIDAQVERFAEIAVSQPDAIAVVESALIFSTNYGPGGSWHARFDRILLVIAPDALKIARFVERRVAASELSVSERGAIEADARQRLALQHTQAYASQCLVLHNDGDIEQLEMQVDAVWAELKSSL